MANILYFSCHSTLEYMEVKLLTEMGHNVFSLGAYQINNQGTNLRGAIPGLYKNQHLVDVSLGCSKEDIHKELIDWADVIILMHNTPSQSNPQPWVANNWEKFKKAKKPVIWRSIGQSSASVEKSLAKYRKEGLKIVRYSPKEDTIPGYVGADAMIRFYTDPSELDGYVGDIPRIVNVSQAMFGNDKVPSRGDHMNLKEFKQVVDGFDWKIFGPDNENAGEHNGGQLEYEDLKQMLRLNRVYFYTGTRPASYTLAGMDAMMLGIPIVAIGPKLGNSVYTDQSTYEVHEIIGASGEAGFWSDDIQELREYCKILLEDADLAKQVGARGRLRAIQYFGKDTIKESWRKFLENL